METAATILIVECDTALAENLWKELRLSGHESQAAFTIERAYAMIACQWPRAVLLRWKLPDAPGSLLIRDLRRRSARTRLPIIVLGEPDGSEEECISALNVGADDYVKHPYGIQELIARTQGVLRPFQFDGRHRRINFGTLTLDCDARRAFAQTGANSESLELHVHGATCYRLLTLFVQNPLKVLTRKNIIEYVWYGASIKQGTVDAYINSLRKALAPLKQSLVIETVRGAGFRLSTVSAIPAVTQRTPGSLQSGDSAEPPPVRTREDAAGNDRFRDRAAGDLPVLGSGFDAAIEKIRHLQTELDNVTTENRVLRKILETRKKPLEDSEI